MTHPAAGRLRTLDLIRGVAVLGILAVNIASFASTSSASYSPDLPVPGTPADHVAYLATLILFEGKMRALFSMLFGASMLLFIDRADAAGRNGQALQLRRLGWLALFGFLHFLLIWQWDILFLYAVVGCFALSLRAANPKGLLFAAWLVFCGWQVLNTAQWLPSLVSEAAVISHTASPAQIAEHDKTIASYRADDVAEAASVQQNWAGLVSEKLRTKAFFPLISVVFVSGETLPYILIGMALLKSGFFSGAWPRRRLMIMALGGIGAGGAATLAFAAWANAYGFPEITMKFAIGYGLSFPHILMALGYAATLVLLAPRLLVTGLGKRLSAAGQTAFSNYLGTSLVMTAIFYGWGLGLNGRYGAAGQALFVLLGWAAMLGWSQPWLARFRQGPLEWLWRSLTEWQLLPNRKASF